jgi:Malectin domain
VLILNFCELNFFYTNQRVCHIYLGDTVVRPNHDTLKGGRQSQVSIYLPFNLKDGKVTYARHMDCQNSYNQATRTLRLRFKKVIDNPKVDGIILFKGRLEGIWNLT